MLYTIDNENKDFVGIGKMMIDTGSREWNVPLLHFVVCDNDGLLEAFCLELGLVAGAEVQEEAVKRLVGLTLSHINAVMTKGGGFEELKEVAQNGFMNEYWNAYRSITFGLAEKGIGLDLEENLKKETLKPATKTAPYNMKELKYYRLEKAA
jgi:hypothetical protein